MNKPLSAADLELFAAFAKSTAAEGAADLPTGWQADTAAEPPTLGRPKGKKPPLTQREKDAKRARCIEAKQRRNNILVLDMETDPFDNASSRAIKPFLCVLYSPRFDELNIPTDPRYPGCVVIWENDDARLIDGIDRFLESLPEKFSCYCHNGGRFDYLFLLRRLVRGAVAFKGRGVMSAMVRGHALRDSFHIIPEALSSIQKDAFDYHNMRRGKREKFRDRIISYCVNDCRYLYAIVRDFITGYGPKLTIGQAALGELRKHYEIKKFSEHFDGYIRKYYFGGHVECIAGAGEFEGPWKIFDINSSYPNVMAKYVHPIGDFFDYTLRKGDPGPDTCFIDLDCDNRGALMGRDDDGLITMNLPRGNFKTTIHEYNVALRYNLISNITINLCVDCSRRSDFSKFVLPLYEKRHVIKLEMAAMKARGGENSEAWFILKRESILLKLILNNAYGKTGQNPREFMDHYLTEPDELPEAQWLKSLDYIPEDERKLYDDALFKGEDYWIWGKPAPRHSFVNVGIAASVTGAARAVLLEALQHADTPIYCDTDSIICRDLNGVDLDPARLGAWNLEETATAVIIAGKKLYGVMHARPKVRTIKELEAGMVPEYTIKSKGIGAGALAWHDIRGMLNGRTTLTRNRAPTIDRFGDQRYIEREVRATTPRK